MSETELKNARVRRRIVKSSLTRASTFLESGDIEGTSTAQIRQRKEKAESLWQEFDESQTTIDLAAEGELSDDHRKEFEDAYFDIIARFDELIINRVREAGGPPQQGIDGQQNNNLQLDARNVNNQLRLPKCELPTFAGGYEEWYPFRDTFNALIHNVEGIPDIQKFHYLKSSVRDEAAEVIQSLEVSADNYTEAWQILQQRYDNKRLIVQKHIKAMFELPEASKESHSSLRALLDGVLKHKRALAALGRSAGDWDYLLIHLITSKIDVTTNREWENSLKGPEIPTLDNLKEFIEHRCHTLEIIQKRNCSPSVAPGANKQRQAKSTHANVATTKEACPICKGKHFVYMCETFRKMAVSERATAIRDKKLCLNCMRSTSHQAKECRSSSCKNCGKKHNTLLHFTAPSAAQEPSQGTSQQESTAAHVSTAANVAQEVDSPQVWLSTAMVEVTDVNGTPHTCRALLDPGSQSNIVTEDLAERLSLRRHATNVSITGINQATSTAKNVIKIALKSRFYSFNRNVECLVLSRITGKIPTMNMDKSRMNIPQNLRLADPQFSTPGKIDILIGAALFWECLCVGQIPATNQHPVLQKTLFGWILGGSTTSTTKACTTVMCNLVTNQQLDDSLTKFWETEWYAEKTNRTIEEKRCNDHFVATHRRDSEGRFIVQLPFKTDMLEQLGDSKDTALRRFYALERKLKKNQDLRRQYVAFLDEYQNLGHMEIAQENDSSLASYCMPHHPVIKETSETTRLRVVFDASCKTTTGVSLNEVLMVGPTLQPDLFDIIVRFRAWRYVMTADVEKMYLQVRLDESQTRYQRILWRSTSDEPVKTFELKTVTYGTTSASFLAIRALTELAYLEKAKHPTGSAAILTNF